MHSIPVILFIIFCAGPINARILQCTTFDRIKLPSGKTLTEAMVRIPKQWQSELFPSEAPILICQYPNGVIQGVHTYSYGKLNGATAILDDNGKLSTLANYHKGQLDGQLRCWEQRKEDEERIAKKRGSRLLFFGEYSRGRKNGLSCLFDKGLPWLIQEWDKNTLVDEYLVKFADGKSTVVSWAKLEPVGPDLPPKVFEKRIEKMKEFVSAKRRLRMLELKMQKHEVKIKKEVLTWYRKEDQRIKQTRSARYSVAARQATSERINARRAATAAVMEAQSEAWQRRTLP
ncbi:MAG TPA: hypothetical protein VMY37_04495 [Thermoguttaceae bacterium]|nr:hypothetical protein [Thermoguttaceae bacterium]